MFQVVTYNSPPPIFYHLLIWKINQIRQKIFWERNNNVNSESYDELWQIPFATIKKNLCFVRDKNSKVKMKKKVIHFQEVRFLDYNLACAYTLVNFFPKIIYLDFSVFFSRCE